MRLAGFAVVYGFIGIAVAPDAGQHPVNLWLAGFPAGTVWGGIVGVGLTFLSPRRQPLAAGA